MSLYNHDWSSITPDETLEIFETNILGLADEAVLSRREIHGMNTLPETSKDSYFFIFLRQFTSPLLYILVGAAIIAVLLGEITDGIIIGAVLLLNGFMGAFQEGKAQDALFALKKLTDFQTLVVRNGVHDLISSTLLVPGDVIILREGDKVPADGRILESKDFSTSEALLTGESFPVSKNNTTLPLNEERMITDQVNMVLSGTTVAKGTAHVVVVATGIETELGKISQNIKENTTEIPLQVQVRNLARIIIVVVVLAIGFLFGAGILLGNDVSYMFLVALSLMVSVIPEGLPVVMTLILARGVKRMSEHNALVKRLQAVEALGQATIIAVDKTGTLTKNELSVVQCFIDDTLYNVSGTGYNPQGTITGPEGSQDRDHRRALDYITMISALASDAKIFYQDDAVTYVGDPTEIALIVFGKKIIMIEKKVFRVLIISYTLLLISKRNI
ncbi:MAG: HAD-IC family P-type ATPase [Candidatus Pacebacteria bacterium]|nr:HAD-IC family P-type ATPase [Candidatus Paceibacterota bacterium]